MGTYGVAAIVFNFTALVLNVKLTLDAKWGVLKGTAQPIVQTLIVGVVFAIAYCKFFIFNINANQNLDILFSSMGGGSATGASGVGWCIQEVQSQTTTAFHSSC